MTTNPNALPDRLTMLLVDSFYAHMRGKGWDHFKGVVRNDQLLEAAHWVQKFMDDVSINPWTITYDKSSRVLYAVTTVKGELTRVDLRNPLDGSGATALPDFLLQVRGLVENYGGRFALDELEDQPVES